MLHINEQGVLNTPPIVDEKGKVVYEPYHGFQALQSVIILDIVSGIYHQHLVDFALKNMNG